MKRNQRDVASAASHISGAWISGRGEAHGQRLWHRFDGGRRLWQRLWHTHLRLHMPQPLHTSRSRGRRWHRLEVEGSASAWWDSSAWDKRVGQARGTHQRAARAAGCTAAVAAHFAFRKSSWLHSLHAIAAVAALRVRGTGWNPVALSSAMWHTHGHHDGKSPSPAVRLARKSAAWPAACLHSEAPR